MVDDGVLEAPDCDHGHNGSHKYSQALHAAGNYRCKCNKIAAQHMPSFPDTHQQKARPQKACDLTCMANTDATKAPRHLEEEYSEAIVADRG